LKQILNNGTDDL